MDVQEAIRRACRRFALLPPGSTLIVAVSGGPDSVALLHALHALGAQHTLRVALHAATFDHRLRGADSAEDARFTAGLCAAWGIPCTSGQAQSVPASEAHARQMRYRFLAEIMRAHGAQRAATAHHADDQGETILMRLLRGTGLDGLAGMGPEAPLPGAPDLRLVRPMLGVTRAQIDAYLQAHHLPSRQDASNADDRLTRNYLRLRVLPVIDSRFPGARRALAQLGEQAALDRDFLEDALQHTLLLHTTVSPGRVAIARERFLSAHPALQRRWLVWGARQLEHEKEPGWETTAAALEGLLGPGARAQLPGGLTVRAHAGSIEVLHPSFIEPSSFT